MTDDRLPLGTHIGTNTLWRENEPALRRHLGGHYKRVRQNVMARCARADRSRHGSKEVIKLLAGRDAVTEESP